jgi:hypothetical protein
VLESNVDLILVVDHAVLALKIKFVILELVYVRLHLLQLKKMLELIIILLLLDLRMLLVH